jgi:hypothetical protein
LCGRPHCFNLGKISGTTTIAAGSWSTETKVWFVVRRQRLAPWGLVVSGGAHQPDGFTPPCPLPVHPHPPTPPPAPLEPGLCTNSTYIGAVTRATKTYTSAHYQPFCCGPCNGGNNYNSDVKANQLFTPMCFSGSNGWCQVGSRTRPSPTSTAPTLSSTQTGEAVVPRRRRWSISPCPSIPVPARTTREPPPLPPTLPVTPSSELMLRKWSHTD